MRTQLAIAIMLLLALAACTVEPTGRATSREPIKIGVILSLTGTSADAGYKVRNGLELALQEINSDLSTTKTYALVYEDSQYNPQTAVSAINKLMNLDKTKFIIGAYGSSETLAIAPIAEANQIILITPTSQADEITSAGDYIFRTQISSAEEMPILSDYLVSRMQNKPLSVIAFNTAYGQSVVKYLQEEYAGKGGQLGIIELIDSGETDFRNALMKISSSGTKDLLIVTSRKAGGLITKQAKELGLEMNYYGTSVIEGGDLLEAANGTAEGLTYTYPYDAASQDKAMQDFRQKYNAEYDKISDMNAANGYDALKVLVNCIEKTGSETEQVKNCLYSIRNYEGASGTLSFDKNGDVIKPIMIKTVKNRTFVKYEE